MLSNLVANYDVTYQEGYNAYLAAVGPTIVAHNGKILVAGPNSKPVGGNPGGVTVVLKFPSREVLEGWYNSSEYQGILNLRLANTAGSLVFADEFVVRHK